MPLALLLFLGFLFLAAPMLQMAIVSGTRVLVQQAADAAALAGAQQAVVREEVDARGAVYCESLAVDPVAAPGKAAETWQANVASQPSLQALTWVPAPDGMKFGLQSTVSLPPGGLILMGFRDVEFPVAAQAEQVQPEGVAACP